MNFIDILLDLIDSAGVSKNKVLTDLHLSKNSILDWKNRNTIPNGETLSKIANYFNVSTDYLLGNTDIKNKPTAESSELIDPIDLKIVELLKKMNPRDKAAIMAQIDALANLPSDSKD